MYLHPTYIQVETLLRHGKTDEAIKRLHTHLAEHPDDLHARYLLAWAFYLSHKLVDARTAAEGLFAEDPEQPHLINLLAEIDLAEEKYEAAETKARFLIGSDADHVAPYLLLARIKFLQRNYDAALIHVDKALEIDPENKEALNLKVRISDTLGQYEMAQKSIDELLQLDPENPTTLANLGLQKLNEGKITESLELFAQALAIQPTNMLARHGMMEALKSKFWIYRLFYHYQKFVSRLSAKNSWVLIIGTYLAARVIGGLAEASNGNLQIILNTLVVLMALTFFLSWVINPLLNLVLSQNKYGKLLLDDREKKMAKLTGASMLIAILSFAGYFLVGYYRFLLAGFIFIGLMIPAGTFLNPEKTDKQQKLRKIGLVILLTGLLAIIFEGGIFLIITLLSLLGYQFYFNKMMISQFSRKFEQ
ncbi:MAG: tetratricopeptide repeat protein [Saprospiraceae bacterium]|nr:tetratricopeptide repeat protein [Saprospiraceae bacterium]